MKAIRYIAFLLSFMVMMGHDIVPHIHADEDHEPEHSATMPNLPGNGLTDIQNAFAHFQHSSVERHLVYLSVSEKKADFQAKSFFNFPFPDVIEYPLVWYANYKKQRFWDYAISPPDHKLNSFSLRGPPPFC